jgi:hypothetical protein
MASIRIKGYVTASRYRWMGADEPLHYSFQTWEPRKDDTETFVVCEHAFEVDVPDGFNANAAEIAALEARKDALAAAFAKQVREIQERLAKLQALEYTPVAEAA